MRVAPRSVASSALATYFAIPLVAVGQAALHEFEAGADRHQQVVEIVRHAAGELADRFELLALAERRLGLVARRLRLAPLGDVDHRHHHAGDVAAAFERRARRDLHLRDLARAFDEEIGDVVDRAVGGVEPRAVFGAVHGERFGRDEVAERAPDDLVAAVVAHERQPAVADARQPALAVDRMQHHRGLLVEVGELAGAFAHRVLERRARAGERLARAHLFVDIGAAAVPADDGARCVAHRLGAAEDPAIVARTVAQTVFDAVRRAGVEAVPPGFQGARLIVGVEHAVPFVAVGRSFGYAGEFVPAMIVEIVEAVGPRGPDHLVDRIDDRLELLFAGEQRVLALREPDELGARGVLAPAGLERGAHRAHQIVGVERARQQMGVAEPVDARLFQLAAPAQAPVGEDDEGQARPFGLRIDKVVDRLQRAGVGHRLLGDQDRADTFADARRQRGEVGRDAMSDAVIGEQPRGNGAVAAARGEDGDAQFVRRDIIRHRRRRPSARRRPG